MGRRRCCCGCVIASDDFNRANSTNLGSNWTELAGDWSIASNQLTVATSDAEARFEHTSPAQSTYHFRAVLYPENEGDQLYICIDDRYYLIIDRGPAGYEWRARWYDEETDEYKATRAASVGTTVTHVGVNIAVTPTYLQAYIEINGAASPFVPAGDPITLSIPLMEAITEYRPMLGTFTNTGTAKFDDVVMEKYLPWCGNTDIRCPYIYWPVHLEDATTSLDTDDWTFNGADPWELDVISGKPWAKFTGAASIYSKIIEPFEEYHFLVESTIDVDSPSSEGDVARVYFGGSTNFVQVEWKDDGGGNIDDVDISIWKGGVQDGTAETVTSAGDTVTVVVCVTTTNVTANVGDTKLTRSYTPASYETGIGAFGVQSAIWMDMQVEITGAVRSECTNCGPECDDCVDSLASNTMWLTIANYADDECSGCDAINGIYELLYSGGCQWNYSGSISVCGESCTITIQFSSTEILDTVYYWGVSVTVTCPVAGIITNAQWKMRTQTNVDCITYSDTGDIFSGQEGDCDAPSTVLVAS